MHELTPTIITPEFLLDQLSVPTRLGSRPSLDQITRLLAELGNPHRAMSILHIGGTSGKGSTATIAAEILRGAGYRVGLHVKPHLERVEERFVVDGQAIESDQLVSLIQTVAPLAQRIQPSWYELTVALAFDFFRQARVDLAVIEVGLGGTYDATNVVDPAVTILTNVGLDHTEVLGDTIEKIIADKVGIAKLGRPMICGVTQPSAAAIVAERCRTVGAPLWQLGRDYSFVSGSITRAGSTFDLALPTGAMLDLSIRALGRHQIANAATAVAGVIASGVLDHLGRETIIRRALADVAIPGRIEIVQDAPLVILDGAHNPAKMAALDQALGDLYPGRPVIGVVAFKRGHDVASTLRAIAPRCRQLILTSFEATTDFGRGQAVDPAELERISQELGLTSARQIIPDPIAAVATALDQAGPSDLICVTGSLYLVGAVRGWFREGG